jgi:hypothetical protein
MRCYPSEVGSTATHALSIIEASATPLATDVRTIELAGGSVRCRLAGVHLARHDLRPADDALLSIVTQPSPTPR